MSEMHPTPRDAPIPMRLLCPSCGALHIDEGEFATKPHHTHACQNCGEVWRPAVVTTVGVRFLPGFKNDPDAKPADYEWNGERVTHYRNHAGTWQSAPAARSDIPSAVLLNPGEEPKR